MKNFLLLLLCCCAGPVLAGEPSPLRFQYIVIDDKPPQNPWIKIVGDLNGDGKPDIIIGGSKGPLVWYRNPDWKEFHIADGGYNTVAGAAVDARSLAWRSWLSGAKGYTYGAGDTPPKCPQGGGGVWRWVTDREKPDFWEKAIGWESSFQMQYLHDFLAGIEWWNLEPAHDLIRNQPDDVTHRMVLAKVAGHNFAVAYLPDNDGIDVNLSAFSVPMVARWFDPVRGRSFPVTGRIPNQANHRFTPPSNGSGHDWVLVLDDANKKVSLPGTKAQEK